MEYHQLTYRERNLIAQHKSSGESLRAIGKMLGRSASTISRELRRNATRSDGRYRVDKADSYARARRWRSRMGTQFEPKEVELVHELMAHRWSPQQISGRLGKLGWMNVGTQRRSIGGWPTTRRTEG